jgi:hypothetical protein
MHTHGAMSRSARATASVVGTIGAILAGFLMVTAGNSSSWADGPEGCEVYDEETETCLKWTIPGATPTVPGNTGEPGGGTAACHDKDGTEVPCTKDGLTWWGSPRWCYAEPQQPQNPPPRGHENENGMWWTCQTGASGNAASYTVWWASGGAAPVDGAAVARELVLRIPFELADAKIAPPPTYHTYISYKNWLWIESSQWHTVSASRSVRGATVTLTASPSYVEWDMGNEDTVSCVGAGRAWVKGMPENAPTNCSYAYEEMEDPEGDTWTVSARISYTLAWTCTGNWGGSTSGDLGSQLAAAGDSTTITVYQRQTVNKNGG